MCRDPTYLYTAHVNSAQNISSVLHGFEHGNAFETYSDNFYLGLPHLEYGNCMYALNTLGIYCVDKLSVILRYGTKLLHQ